MPPEKLPSLLKIRDFVRLLCARVFAMLAVEMVNVAVGWKVYAVTHSPLALGLIALVQFLTVLPLTFITGAVADYVDRRLVLKLSFSGSALCVLALLLLSVRHYNGVALVFVTMAALVGVRAFSFPALLSIMPNIVPRERFSVAVAWVSSVNKIATVSGPAIGGLLYAINEPLVFIAAAFCFVAAAVCASLLRLAPHVSPPQAVRLSAVFDGLGFVVAHRTLLSTISLDLFATLLGGATAMLPIYARDIFHSGPVVLGLLRSAPAIGAGLVAVYLTRWPLQHRAGKTMLVCVGLFGIATVVFGVSTHLFVALAALVVLGGADMCSVFVRQTILQMATPDALRGRVSAVSVLFVSSSNQLGQVELGTAAELMGIVPSVVFGGIGSIVIALLWAWLFPELRRIDLSHSGMTDLAETGNSEQDRTAEPPLPIAGE